MTVQKKILDLTGTQYLVQKITGEIPVKISDLQDDVSLGTHIADTDIHVTTADKNKWNNQTYVVRYSSTVLVDSSTNSNALLDNTDNLKVGDKVIDSSGVLFSITAIDTQNSTFTIGTALIDLANDSDVVHVTGNETIAGVKSFSDETYIKSLNFTNEVASTSSSSSSVMPLVTTVTYTDKTASKVARINLRITASGDKSLYPYENNQYTLGLTSRKWSEVHSTTYYYGSSDVEFSTKFVTTDTAQTIAGNKTFSNFISSNGSYLGNEISTNERTNLYLLANRDTNGQSGVYIDRFRQNRAQGAMSDGDVSFVSFDFLENSTRYARCFTMGLTDWDSNGVPQTYYITTPNGKGSLGTSYQQWNKVYANEYYYGSANTEFSSKFVTTDTNQTISGVKTFSDIPVFSAFNGIRFRCAHNSNAYVTFRNSNQANPGSIILSAHDGSVSTVIHIVDKTLIPYNTNDIDLGTASRKWKSINGLNPSSLGMPDLSNGIDISSYLTAGNSNNTYTPPANGFVSVSIGIASDGCAVFLSQGDMYNACYSATGAPNASGVTACCMLPVIGGVQMNIGLKGSNNYINSAKFYPCLGNV